MLEGIIFVFFFKFERYFSSAFFSWFQTTNEERVLSKCLVHILNYRAQF